MVITSSKPSEIFIHKPYHPKLRIIVLTIEARTKLLTESLVEVTKIFQEHNIKMLSCIMDSHPHEDKVYATIFLDVSELDLTLNELVIKLRQLPGITYVEYIVVPLTHGLAHLVAFTLHDIFNLVDGAHRRFGSIGKVFLFHVGHEVGARKAEELMSVFGVEKTIKYMTQWIQSLGWGRVDLIECIPYTKCTLKIRNLFECVGIRSDEPRSHLFRGFLAGFFSKIWNRQVTVIETKCMAKGDPYCEFMIVAQ